MAKVTKVEIFQGKDGSWFFRFKARNGKVIAQSEGYTRKFDAQKGAQRALDARG